MPPTVQPSFAQRAGLAIVAGLLMAVVAIVVSLADRPGPPPSVLKDAVAVNALFKGIPEQGNTVGAADAPLQLVVFVDPQCPYCRQWETKVLPLLVSDYVRPGKLQITVQILHFIGPDSTTAATYLEAAGMQNLLWPTIELLYQNQGEENSGWFTNAFVRSLGRSVHGLEVARWQRDAHSSTVSSALASSEALASQSKVDSTPTLLLGRRGGPLQLLPLKTLLPQGTIPFIETALKGTAQ